jgi:tetratricopeptide (TPR) repeat protein
MAIDPYSLCSGGTGKKLKFCCHDLLGELDQIDRMLEGEQRKACLEYLQKLDQKHPGRACLMTTKAMLERVAGDLPAASRTIEPLLVSQPENSVARAEAALQSLMQRGASASVDALQKAFETAKGSFSPLLLDALLLAADGFLRESKPFAARGHLLMVLAAVPDDETASSYFLRFNTSALPLLAKQSMHLTDCGDDAPWKSQYRAAMRLGQQGAWKKAAAEFARLAEQSPTSPDIWRNLAVCRTLLGDNLAAATAWHKLATLDIPLDDAALAEATAQTLEFDPDDPTPGETVALLNVTFPVIDVDRALELLASDRRCRAKPMPSEPDEDGSPPPKVGYDLLDRPMPTSGAELTRDDVPRALGTVLLYGRQTDREARLEWLAWQDSAMEGTRSFLRGLLGNAIGDPIGEQELNKTSGLAHAIRVQIALPEDTPPDRRRSIIAELRQSRHSSLGQVPQRALGGKTAEEAVGDPSLRIKLAGMVLRIESTFNSTGVEVDGDELRRRWGVPIPEPVEVAGRDLFRLPLMSMSRARVEKLSDEELMQLYIRAHSVRASEAALLAAHEIVARPGMDQSFPRDEVFGFLAEMADDHQQALAYLDQARESAVAAGRSSANWDIIEMRARIEALEIAEFQRLFEHVIREHIEEPGVRQAIGQLMMELGMIDEHGNMLAPPGEAEMAAAAPAEAGKIWTPGEERGGEKKSGLWLPGMS